MADRLPALTADGVLRVLRRDGWQEDRRSGGHIILLHHTKPGHVSIPFHKGRTLPAGTLAAILNQAGISREQLRRLL